MKKRLTFLQGHVLDRLRELPDCSVHCVVTSPPYWGLRDYGVDGQLGLEETPAEYIANMVEVFEEVRRVLRKDGTCWVNMGDTYSASGAAGNLEGKQGTNKGTHDKPNRRAGTVGLKQKNLCGVPWRLALALQDAGWYLRSDIIWSKPNPMPSSVKDRPSTSHEYIFLLTKSAKYWYDADAIMEPVTGSTLERIGQPNLEKQEGSARANGGAKTNGNMKAVVAVPDHFNGSLPGRKDGPGQDRRSKLPRFGGKKYGDSDEEQHRTKSGNEYAPETLTRNARTVWTIATQPYAKAHFATFPSEIPRRCILAGCPEGGTVLDPFLGSGTTIAVAIALGRLGIGIELKPEYLELARERCRAYAEKQLQARLKAERKRLREQRVDYF